MGYLYLCDIETADGVIYRKLGRSNSPKMRLSMFGKYGASVKLLDCREVNEAEEEEQKLLKEWRNLGWQIDGPKHVGVSECFSQEAPNNLSEIGEKVDENVLDCGRTIVNYPPKLLNALKKIAKQNNQPLSYLLRALAEAEAAKYSL